MLALQMLWNKWELSMSTKMYTYPLKYLTAHFETIEMELITFAGHFSSKILWPVNQNAMIHVEVVFFLRIPLVSSLISLYLSFLLF